MRISLLLEREPFGEILEKTLARFWQERYGREYQVRWYGKLPGLRAMRRRGEQPWLGNIYLNAIFTPDVDPDAFDPIRREFSRSLSVWKRPLQRAYVSAAASRRSASWLAQAGLGVSPAVPGSETQLILGGNHKIRILDHRNGLAYGILKEGFDPAFMRNEIETRRLARECGVPVPELVEVGEDLSWFSERYISGTPVNRLKDREKAQEIVRAAFKALEGLYERTREEVPLKDYVGGLRAQIESLVAQNRLLTQPQKSALVDAVNVISRQIEALSGEAGGSVTTALTHGDFQPANILADGNDFWLIDWEYAGRRWVGYDRLVFSLGTRFPTGLAHQLRQCNLQDAYREVQYSYLDEALRNKALKNTMASLFMLEELLIRFMENKAKFFRMQKSLEIFLQEFNTFMACSD